MQVTTKEIPSEKKIPQKPRKRTGGFLKLFGFFVMLALLALAVIYLPVFKVSDIEIVGSSKVDKETLLLASEIVPGENMLKVNFKRAKEAISKIPYIDLVDVKISLPNTIRIVVKESVLFAYIDYGGLPAGIDAGGKVLEIGKDKQPDIIAVEGTAVAYCAEGEKIAFDDSLKLEALLDCFKSIKEARLETKITKINLEKLHDVKMLYGSHIWVYFGNTEKLSYKAAMLNQVVSNIDITKKGKIDLHTMQGKAIYSEGEE